MRLSKGVLSDSLLTFITYTTNYAEMQVFYGILNINCQIVTIWHHQQSRQRAVIRKLHLLILAYFYENASCHYYKKNKAQFRELTVKPLVITGTSP